MHVHFIFETNVIPEVPIKIDRAKFDPDAYCTAIPRGKCLNKKCNSLMKEYVGNCIEMQIENTGAKNQTIV